MFIIPFVRAIFGEFVRNFGRVFAILFEAFSLKFKRKSITLFWGGGGGGGLRGTKTVNRFHWFPKLAWKRKSYFCIRALVKASKF